MAPRVRIAVGVAAAAAAAAAAAQPAAAAKALRLCAEPSQEEACEALSEALADSSGLNTTCVNFDNCRSPLGPLFTGEADVAFDMDSGQLYEMYRVFDDTDSVLTIVAHEHEDGEVGEQKDLVNKTLEDVGYWPIPVVTAEWCEENPNATWADLEGTRVCSTGYQKTAGWRASVGTMLEVGTIPAVTDGASDTPNDIMSVSEFFASGCVPGADNEVLCQNCAGVGEDFCEQVDGEPYENYPGALRCLAEGAGDVALIRHRTPGTYLEGGDSFDPTWNYTNGQTVDDYRVLCGGVDGAPSGCVPIEEYESCSFPKTIGHTVVAANGTEEQLAALSLALQELSVEDAAFQEAFLKGGTFAGALFDPEVTFLEGQAHETAESIEPLVQDLFASFESLDQLNEAGGCAANFDIDGDGQLTVSDVQLLNLCVVGDANTRAQSWCASFFAE